MANPLRTPLAPTAPARSAPAPAAPAGPAGFNWMDVVSAPQPLTVPQPSAMPQPSGRYTGEYLQEAERAAQQMMQNELAQQKMLELQRYQQSLSEQNPRFQTPYPVSRATDIVATPAFYDDPAATIGFAKKSFTAMTEMPSAPLFEIRRGGSPAPDPAYTLSQEVAKARGFDPMGREAAALYGQYADRVLAERYHDALSARNAYGAPVDAYQNYVDMTSISPGTQPNIHNPRAMNMSDWFDQDREKLRGQSVTAYFPKTLMQPPPMPEMYQRDPLTVNIARHKLKTSSE